MAERQRLPLPWGEGLDRASGLAVVDAASWADLRNVLLYDGKASVRPGLQLIVGLEDDLSVAQTDVLALYPFRKNESLLIVAWDRATRKVNVFDAAANGQNPAFVATWFTAEAIVGTPRVSVTESSGRIFLAHEFQILKPAATYLRAKTVMYDGTTITDLTADLDRTGGAEDLRFRIVSRYLHYLVGCGYGTGSEEDRPEIVRVSLPGDPLTFNPEHYFIAGQRGEAVMAALPGPRSFLVFKETEQYEIFGTDRRTFGILGPTDPAHGCIGAKLAISWAGMVWVWSFDGPRRTTGGPSEPLDLPLDLAVPTPADLVAEGLAQDAFVVANPRDRTLEWYWPSGSDSSTRVYVLHVRDYPRRLRWSYHVIGKRIWSGTVIYPTAAAIPPPGYPDLAPAGALDVSEAYTFISSTACVVNWVNVDALGDEVTEIWLRDVTAAGPWTLKASVAWGDYSIGGSAPNRNVTGLEPVHNYEAALRHKRGALYNAGAESSADPSAWPAASYDATGFTTEAVPAGPTAFTHDGCELVDLPEGTTERHDVSWTANIPDSGWRISRATVNDFAESAVFLDGDSGNTAEFDILQADPDNYYFWVQYNEGTRADPVLSDPTPLDINGSGGLDAVICV